MFNSKIIGLGKYLPENIVTNADLEQLMDTSDAWIQERTGIQERRHITKGDGNSTSVMGVKAARIAIERAGLEPKDIDFILFATLSPDYYFPGSGVLVQEALDIPNCPAMDIRMQCSGFVYSSSNEPNTLMSSFSLCSASIWILAHRSTSTSRLTVVLPFSLPSTVLT